jgi:hypothetical protein
MQEEASDATTEAEASSETETVGNARENAPAENDQPAATEDPESALATPESNENSDVHPDHAAPEDKSASAEGDAEHPEEAKS